MLVVYHPVLSDMTSERVVSRLLQTDRLGLPKCMAACEDVMIAYKHHIPDLHTLKVERLVRLLLR